MNKSATLISLAAIAVLASCGQKKDDNAAKFVTDDVKIVEVAKCSRELVPQTNDYSTTVKANIVNNIAPQTTGRIIDIRVEIGDFVSAGQLLAEMDKSQLEQAELRLMNYESEMQRVEQLFKEGGISQSDYDQVVLSYNVAKSGYDNLLENTILRSPISGVITARNYDKGDMYSMSSPLFTVEQITPVKLLVPISESDYTKVSKGDKVSILADALPGRTYTGTIVRLYPTMDATTHTFNVEVQVGNENRELRPGMYAKATVDFGSNFNIVIPDQAAVKMQGAGTRQVFVLNPDNTVGIKVVSLGRHIDGKYEILSGLDEGDVIVVKGQATLKNGDKVEVR
ncbi:MAG: efflux RND transporter periplasmic adaptor subunit [Bacteroidales bacterium]|nr:efflux RND transporter periplasmic adaptor subunit [Bacteroidales bacterium]